MKRLITLVIILFSLLPISAQAQSTPPAAPTCDLTAIIKEVGAFKSSKDSTKDMTALAQIRDDIDATQAACNGLSFSGKSAKLVGPFDLPDGTYKVTATTKGYLAVMPRTISGDCDPNYDNVHMFNISAGEATAGEDIVYQASQNCRLVLEPSNVSAPWKITFEPLQQ